MDKCYSSIKSWENKAWFNINPKNCNTFSVNLDAVSQLQLSLKEVNIGIVTKSQNSNDSVIKAKQIELENWKSFIAYSEIPNEGRSQITTNWAVTEKEINRKYQLKQDFLQGVFKKSI